MDLADDVRKALSAVNAPGVHLAPWNFRTDDGGEHSLRRNSIGICGGCTLEHDHDSNDDACVLVEFAIVCNNDASLPATHHENRREIATANALVEAFNLLAIRGEEIIAAIERPR